MLYERHFDNFACIQFQKLKLVATFRNDLYAHVCELARATRMAYIGKVCNAFSVSFQTCMFYVYVFWRIALLLVSHSLIFVCSCSSHFS